MNSYNKVKEMWDWTQKIKKITNLGSVDAMRDALLKECFSIVNNPSDFFKNTLSFSSVATRDIALTELKFNEDRFSLVEVLRYIHENMSLLHKDNISNIIMMLVDVTLYEMYNCVRKETRGGFLAQLNECIILDAMKIKPDLGIDVPTELKEVSEKAEMNIEIFDRSVVWAIAMLNYKTHVYRTAISFFKRFLTMCDKEDDPEIRTKKIHARIYMGYCNEKENNLNGFIEAIRIFEELLSEIENEQVYEELVTELHHGLGHFYNEKAIFGRSETECEDIINARKHMRAALEQKSDYYSCYGSLFHEFGDYESAERIFEDALDEDTIKNNEELAKELNFYIGQTGSALNNQNEKNFNVFEEYCKRTLNFDGIVHARIFKIRALLRQMRFSKNNNVQERKNNREKLNKWYGELTEYELSSYASSAIKEEYKKTLYIIKVFQSFYADDRFMWHIEDVQYNLHNFVALMPSYACELDISFEALKKETATTSNLYCMQLGHLWVWCVSSYDLKNLIKEKKLYFSEKLNDTKNVQVYPVEDKNKVYGCIQRNGKPDLVVLLPPPKKDIDFEQEVSSLMNFVSESYFVFTQETSEFYTIEWLKSVTSGKKQVQYCTNTANEMLKFAYCFRALEILRKELLQPIPLFSLAPTHFSSSYDFQLGEDVPIQLEYMMESNNGEYQREIRDKLKYVDTKFNLLRKSNVAAAAEAMSNLCCKDEGFFAACFPHPNTDKEENYISYLVHDQTIFSKEVFPHKVTTGKVYTIKALPLYKDFFWDLYSLINKYAGECDKEIKDECVAHYETILTDNNDISASCRNLLEMIFLDNITVLEHPYKCILRKVEGNGAERDYIYLVLLSGLKQKQEELKNELQDKKGEGKQVTSVFVTYAWEPENTEFQKYQKEVLDFTNELRNHGYDANFDLGSGKTNWTQIMIDGLQKDKIIVLLSPEYKKKADKTIDTGVSIEVRAIVNRLKKGDGSVILAKLSSLKAQKVEELLPVIFSGENVIDLSQDDSIIHDGYNMLYARLADENIVTLNPIGNTKKDIKKM